jgi:hypothetical protein
LFIAVRRTGTFFVVFFAAFLPTDPAAFFVAIVQWLILGQMLHGNHPVTAIIPPSDACSMGPDLSQRSTHTMSTRPTLPCCRRALVKGKDQVVIETTAGQRITLDDASASILIQDTNGNTLRLDPSGITIQAAAKVVLSSSQLEISAGMVTVNAGMAKFSGVIQADTLIANSVVASSYTPGAGNIWRGRRRGENLVKSP